MAVKKKIGRPSEYRPEYDEQVIEMGKAGKSIAQMASAFDVTKKSIHDWAEQHPSFSVALRKALNHAQAHWEELGYHNMIYNGSKFNGLVYKLAMTNRFKDDYSERARHEISGPNGAPIETKVEQRIKLNVEELTPEQRDALRAALLTVRKG